MITVSELLRDDWSSLEERISDCLSSDSFSAYKALSELITYINEESGKHKIAIKINELPSGSKVTPYPRVISQELSEYLWFIKQDLQEALEKSKKVIIRLNSFIDSIIENKTDFSRVTAKTNGYIETIAEKIINHYKINNEEVKNKIKDDLERIVTSKRLIDVEDFNYLINKYHNRFSNASLIRNYLIKNKLSSNPEQVYKKLTLYTIKRDKNIIESLNLSKDLAKKIEETLSNKKQHNDIMIYEESNKPVSNHKKRKWFFRKKQLPEETVKKTGRVIIPNIGELIKHINDKYDDKEKEKVKQVQEEVLKNIERILRKRDPVTETREKWNEIKRVIDKTSELTVTTLSSRTGLKLSEEDVKAIINKYLADTTQVSDEDNTTIRNPEELIKELYTGSRVISVEEAKRVSEWVKRQYPQL